MHGGARITVAGDAGRLLTGFQRRDALPVPEAVENNPNVEKICLIPTEENTEP